MLFVRYRFARCFRDLKRLEGITRSPIYSYLSSTIQGLKVIRSHSCRKNDVHYNFLSYPDDHIRTSFLIITTERWADMRFDWVTLDISLLLLHYFQCLYAFITNSLHQLI